VGAGGDRGVGMLFFRFYLASKRVYLIKKFYEKYTLFVFILFSCLGRSGAKNDECFSKHIEDGRVMNSSRSTIGYIEDGRIMNSSRSTIGYYEDGRVMNSSRSTIGYFEDNRVMNSSRGTIGYIEDGRALESSRSTMGYFESVRRSDAMLYFFFFFY
jgi:hypothetical protein